MKKNYFRKGASIVEVLVSVLIVTIGIVGVLGLFAFTQKSISGSGFRTMASFFAYELSERMRANATALSLWPAYQISSLSSSSSLHSECFTTGCNFIDRADTDIFEWRQRIATSLPQGQAIACKLSASYPTCASIPDGTSLSSACLPSTDSSILKADKPYVICIRWKDNKFDQMAQSGATSVNGREVIKGFSSFALTVANVCEPTTGRSCD